MLADTFRKWSPERLAELPTGLALEGPRDVAAPAVAWTAGVAGTRRARLATAEEVEPLRVAVDALVAHGFPPVALYAFAAPWVLGERLRAAAELAFGARYLLLDDVWAFRVPPGARGWAPHRGSTLRLAPDAPELVNAWIALSDAPATRSCLWFVPLEDDLHRASADDADLARVDVPEDRFVPAPVVAGEVLAWDANVLHAGGPSSPDAPGPRTSITFTLVREDHASPPTDPFLGGNTAFAPNEARALDPWRRLELVARQLLVYGDGQPHVTADDLAWAKATAALARQLGRRP